LVDKGRPIIALTQTNAHPRKLGFWMAVALVMGNMIGSGVFLLPASLAPYGWNAVAAWGITITGAMALAYVLARLTTALPAHRGPIGFVTHAFGAVPGFLVGWIYWVSIWTAVVTIAVAGVSYLSTLIPQMNAAPFVPALCAVGLLWAVTIINLLGVRRAGQFQVVTTVLKLLPIIAVISVAIIAIASGTAAKTPVVAFDFSSIHAAAALTLWALLGFESASLAAEKIDDPARNIPRATLWGTGLTGLLYLAVCSVIALMLPAAIAQTSAAPFASFIAYYGAPEFAHFIAAFAAISCIGALNGWVLMQGELPRSMAAQGLLPPWLSKTDTQGTAVTAMVVSSVVASIFVLLNAAKDTQALFEYLLLLSTSATLWLYLACALAAFHLRVARPVAVAGAVYALYTLWGAGWQASGLSFVLMAAGVPVYLYTRRGRKGL
jgi:basic amino acid/polyamine antiporter, APA family